MAEKKKQKVPKPPKNYHLINAIRGKKQKNIDIDKIQNERIKDLEILFDEVA